MGTAGQFSVNTTGKIDAFGGFAAIQVNFAGGSTYYVDSTGNLLFKTLTIDNIGAGANPVLSSNFPSNTLQTSGNFLIIDDLYLQSGTGFNAKLTSSITASRNYTFPDSNITVAGIDLAQTWTASQTFNDNVVLNLGTGSDFQIYHDGSHGYLTNSTGHIYLKLGATNRIVIVDSSYTQIIGETYVNLRSATSQSQYFDCGAIFYWRDVDDSFANLMALDTDSRTLAIGSATDNITTTNYGRVNFASGSTYYIDNNGDSNFRYSLFSAIYCNYLSSFTDGDHQIRLDPAADEIWMFPGDTSTDNAIRFLSADTSVAYPIINPINSSGTGIDGYGSLGTSAAAWNYVYRKNESTHTLCSLSGGIDREQTYLHIETTRHFHILRSQIYRHKLTIKKQQKKIQELEHRLVALEVAS